MECAFEQMFEFCAIDMLSIDISYYLGNFSLFPLVYFTKLYKVNFDVFYLIYLAAETRISEESFFSSCKVECFDHAVIRQNWSFFNVPWT